MAIPANGPLRRLRAAGISRAVGNGLLLILTVVLLAERAAAEDDWIGKKTGPAASSSQPSRSLLGSLIDVPGLKGLEIKLDATKILPQMRFSADRRHVFILEKAGILRKLAFPGMEQVGELPINSRCSSLSESKSGLLITLDGKEEVWVVDPETLAVSKRIEVALVASVTGSVTSDIAWARIATVSFAEIAAIDIKAGKAGRQASMKGWGAFRKTYPDPRMKNHPGDLTWPLNSAVSLAATADGKYLIVSESHGRICRYRIQGATLIPEEAQWGNEYGNLTFTLSDDSQYVAAWLRERQVMKIADFSKPVIQCGNQNGSQHEVFAFDRLGQKLYAGGRDAPTLWAINTRGQTEKEFYLGFAAGASLQILVHPNGGGMLLLTERKLYRLELVSAAAIAGAESRPSEGGKALASQVVTFPGGKITCLAGLAGKCADEPLPHDLAPGWCCWSNDGRAVYWLGKDGRLKRIELDGFVVSAEARFAYKPQWLEMSAAGLVTYSLGAQELLVIDPLTLETRQAIAIPTSPRVTSMAASPAVRKVLLHYEETNQLRWVDLLRGPDKPFGALAIKGLLQAKWPEHLLRMGKVDGKLRPESLAQRMLLGKPVLTPDGKHLFTGGDEMYAFRVSGDELVMIAAISTGSPRGQKVVSSDGRYVSITMASLPAEKLSDRRSGVPAWDVVGFPRQAGAVGTRSPFALDLGPGLKAYAVTQTKKLTVCDLAAGKTHDVELPESGWLVDVHPGGKLVLVSGEKNLMFVEMDQDGQTRPEVAPR